MNNIKFSFHSDIIGKPIRKIGHDNRPHLYMGDKQVNLGYGWINVELPYDELFIMLTEGGYALAPYLKSEHRDESNFISSEIALIDIDDGMKITDLANAEFYQKYGSGYYTTPSHTEENHRFRIIYRLSAPVTDPEDMRIIYEGLLAIHGAADVSCKDPSRLFYGTVNAASKEMTDRILTTDGIIELFNARENAKQHRSAPQAYTQCATPLNLQDIGEILNELQRYYPLLPYNERRDVTWAVSAECSDSDTIMLMRSRWNDLHLNGKYEDIISGRKRKDLSIGTVYHMIRQFDPNYRKAPKYKDKKFMENLINNLRKI